MSKNLSELSGRKELDDNIFEELGVLSRKKGTPDAGELNKLSEESLFGKANLYGAATFYDFTKPENKGKKVYVCNGSTCMLAGTQKKLKKDLKKHFKKEEIGEMCCLGRCHENSAFYYEGQNYSAQTTDEIGKIIKKGKGSNKDKYKSGALGEAILTSDFPGIDAYYGIWKKALGRKPQEILEEIKTSNIRGRGGAGFPMGIKLEACSKQESDRKYIVCNADEGDPGAYSDRYLMEKQPHSVLQGMMLAGYATGADRGVLYIRAEYPESIEIIEKAIEEIRKANLIGHNILDSGFNFEFKVIKAQGAYICGEETALLSSIEGQRPEVRVRPPYPVVEGLFNKPTVVNNVETLAAVPWIIENKGKAYAKIGTERSNGTKLVSLDGFFKKSGVYEVDMGTPLRAVIDKLGGGFTEKIKAMHIGGPLGGLVPVSKIDDLTVDFESFQNNGFLLGHASIVCIPEKYELMDYIRHLFEFTAHESCGKCFPCRLGSTRGAEMIEKSQNSDYKMDRELFEDLLETLEIGSLCALGGGLPLPVKNALQYFESELSQYFKLSS